MSILVTGVFSYIGSHTLVALIEAGYSVVLADNISNSKITDAQAVKRLFGNHIIEGVIHFAGYKAVGESVSQPL